MSWILANADLISGCLGITGSIILSIPALSSVRSKRRYESFSRVTRASGQAGEQPVRAAGQRLVDAQLGGARSTLWWNLLGNALLILAFLFLTLAAVERRKQASLPPEAALRPA